jgi:hypothetical protein
MFQPFGELKKKQSLKEVKDYGIGIGLSNSRELARFINGDVQLIKSKQGYTEFLIKLPIKIE